ncbi:MAG: hypothetical protein JWR89_900, partial [Tardiphaga sp.]|uniref:hypothetical protein n=1 Tax=Tardiphaga sp. TaxID=1926292 RepID=UPI00262794C1
HPAEKFQFGRAVHEYARWLAVAEDERSPAPAWWWSPAFAVRGSDEPMSHGWAPMLGLPDNASYADGAETLLHALSDQTSRCWPEEFPRRYWPAATADVDHA